MKEIVGELWDYLNKNFTRICITTNGDINSRGLAVMGRGCAFEAKKRFPWIARDLAQLIEMKGNIFQHVYGNIYAFPVKHHWDEPADLDLIKESAKSLASRALEYPLTTFILPRPGCGNGRLTWEEVKPVIEPILVTDNIWVITKK